MKPGVRAASFRDRAFLSNSVFIGDKCTLKMEALPLMSGGVMLMCLSNLPGRSSAGSNTSGLLVPTLVLLIDCGGLYSTEFDGYSQSNDWPIKSIGNI